MKGGKNLSSSEANSRSTGEAMPPLSWQMKFHYHDHKSEPPECIPGQINQVDAFKIYIIKMNISSNNTDK
jgi:hypothetical protein